MELNVAMFSVGAVILLLAAIRTRRLDRVSKVEAELEAAFDLSGLDLSGRTEYVRCHSHQWALDNLYYRRHGRMGSRLQDVLRDNTLVGFMLIALVLSFSAVVLGLLIVGSAVVFGGAALIIFAGALIGVGPGEPRTSEEFLEHLTKVPLSELNCEDYVYVRVATDSIRSWIRVSAIVGVVFLVSSPWAGLLPDLASAVLATLVGHLILGPAMSLAPFSLVLSLLYMSATIPMLFFFVPRAVVRFVRKRLSQDSFTPTDTSQS